MTDTTDAVPMPSTPGRPPSPRTTRAGATDADAGDKPLPTPPPPRESSSVPIPSKMRMVVSVDYTSLPTSSLPSRRGSPTWLRPTSEWSRRTSERTKLPNLYHGKDEPTLNGLGQYSHLMYTVPRPPVTGTPRFGGGERFDRTKCYEGKENTAKALGQYGHLMYDLPRPKITGTPRFGGGERFDRTKCYEGKENTAKALGQYGHLMYDVPCSKRGSPLWKKRGPSAAFAGRGDRFSSSPLAPWRER